MDSRYHGDVGEYGGLLSRARAELRDTHSGVKYSLRCCVTQCKYHLNWALLNLCAETGSAALDLNIGRSTIVGRPACHDVSNERSRSIDPMVRKHLVQQLTRRACKRTAFTRLDISRGLTYDDKAGVGRSFAVSVGGSFLRKRTLLTLGCWVLADRLPTRGTCRRCGRSRLGGSDRQARGQRSSPVVGSACRW